MTRRVQRTCGVIVGILLIVCGVFFSLMLAAELTNRPRTEDAYVRANIIGIAAHVSGEILALNIVDNQPVHEGDVLFTVDPRPYEIALAEAEATLALVDLSIRGYEDQIIAAKAEIAAAAARIVQARANADYAALYLGRVEPLLGSRFVTPDQVDKARAEAVSTEAKVASLKAVLTAVQQSERLAVTQLGTVGNVNARRVAAQVEVDRAKLFLNYCNVRAPFDGYITNLNISVGEYANEGEEIFAIVDSEIWYVMANFKETYLQQLAEGQLVEIYLLAYPEQRLTGHIQGIGWAITNKEGPTLAPVPTVDPTFDWIRLAQRFPVRIVIKDPPADAPIRMGATASVIVLPQEDKLHARQFPRLYRFFEKLGLID